MFQYLALSLTFIIASEAILNIVALSVTCLTFSPESVPAQIPSSSDKDLWWKGREGTNKWSEL